MKGNQNLLKLNEINLKAKSIESKRNYNKLKNLWLWPKTAIDQDALRARQCDRDKWRVNMADRRKKCWGRVLGHVKERDERKEV